mgnify:CR=1 FL=1
MKVHLMFTVIVNRKYHKSWDKKKILKDSLYRY